MKKVVQDLTSGGIDWQREKWQSGLGSKFIHQGEKNAAKYADEVIVLSKGVQDYFKETYGHPDIRIVHQIKNSLAPTAEDIRFSISADKGFRWLECRPQLFEKQQPDAEPKFDTEQQKAAYWIKHFLEKGDMSANEIYCRLDNEGVSKRVARMVKTEMGIHCYQKKRKWYWSVQPEEGAMNGSQV